MRGISVRQFNDFQQICQSAAFCRADCKHYMRFPRKEEVFIKIDTPPPNLVQLIKAVCFDDKTDKALYDQVQPVLAQYQDSSRAKMIDNFLDSLRAKIRDKVLGPVTQMLDGLFQNTENNSGGSSSQVNVVTPDSDPEAAKKRAEAIKKLVTRITTAFKTVARLPTTPAKPIVAFKPVAFKAIARPTLGRRLLEETEEETNTEEAQTQFSFINFSAITQTFKALFRQIFIDNVTNFFTTKMQDFYRNFRVLCKDKDPLTIIPQMEAKMLTDLLSQKAEMRKQFTDTANFDKVDFAYLIKTALAPVRQMVLAEFLKLYANEDNLCRCDVVEKAAEALKLGTHQEIHRVKSTIMMKCLSNN
jgi:hypothetical protein